MYLRTPHKRTCASYVVEEGIVFLVMCDKAYPKKLAFSYLADVHAAFVEELRREYGEGCVDVGATAATRAAHSVARQRQLAMTECADCGARV